MKRVEIVINKNIRVFHFRTKNPLQTIKLLHCKTTHYLFVKIWLYEKPPADWESTGGKPKNLLPVPKTKMLTCVITNIQYLRVI